MEKPIINVFYGNDLETMNMYCNNKVKLIYKNYEISEINFDKRTTDIAVIKKCLMIHGFHGQISFDILMKCIKNYERVYILSKYEPYDWWRNTQHKIGESIFLGLDFMMRYADLILEYNKNKPIKVINKFY